MKFYTGEHTFSFVDKLPEKQMLEANLSIRSPKVKQVWQVYRMAENGQFTRAQNFLFEFKNFDKQLSKLKKKFKVIEAAGGIVTKEDQVLFIYRMGKWDLPKGKMEDGEVPEETALREVEEECGISVEPEGFIGHTWHTYIHKGKPVLKCTHWYKMQCLSDTKMAPQIEEDIEELRWANSQEAHQELLPQSYPSIKEIFANFEGK